jgi:hypothetical protein
MTRREHDRMVALAYDVHTEARQWSARRSYVVGSVMRGVANRMLYELGETTLPYEGPPPTEPPTEEWSA